MTITPLLIVILTFVVGCAEPVENYKITPFSTFYRNGLEFLKQDLYKNAASQFSQAAQQHPYHKDIPGVLILLAYSYFQSEDYELAIIELDTFLDVHPSSQYVPYALYLKGISFFDQISTLERDQYVTKQAKDAFQQLVYAYPETEYATDAKYKIDFLTNLLAAKEMDIGRFYLKRKKIAPALRRFKEVIEHYSQTEQVPEAFYRMIEGYLLLGLKHEAYTMGYQLGKNHPGSPWYQRGYALLQEHDVS